MCKIEVFKEVVAAQGESIRSELAVFLHNRHERTADPLGDPRDMREPDSYTGQQIADELRISPATVSRILRRLGLNRLAALEPAEPVRRYEREHPGELIHIDIKNSAGSTA